MICFSKTNKDRRKNLWKCQEMMTIQQDFLYHQKYKRIGIDLSIQTIKNIPQQINFVGKLEEDEFYIFLWIH